MNAFGWFLLVAVVLLGVWVAFSVMGPTLGAAWGFVTRREQKRQESLEAYKEHWRLEGERLEREQERIRRSRS